MRRMTSKRTKSLLRRLDRTIAASNRSVFYPIAAKKARVEARSIDLDGNSFVDFNASWTTAPLGYSNPEFISAIEAEMKTGIGLIGYVKQS